MTKRPWVGRVKVLSYRDQQGLPQSAHQAHWDGFRWSAGRTLVAYIGEWGTLQVWAADEQEGRRVIGHACQIAAIPLSGPDAGEWVITQAKAGRNGQPGEFQTAILGGLPVVTKREGPSGPPFLEPEGFA